MPTQTSNISLFKFSLGETGWLTLNENADKLDSLFGSVSGHMHNGAAGQGPKINMANAASGILPVVNGGTGSSGGSITGSGSLSFTAGSTNSNVSLIPSGVGRVVLGNGSNNIDVLFNSDSGNDGLFTWDGTTDTFQMTTSAGANTGKLVLGTDSPVGGAVLEVRTPNATTIGQIINVRSGTSVFAHSWQLNGTEVGNLEISTDERRLALSAFDNGANHGTRIVCQRNSNVSTPAAGFIGLDDLNGTNRRIWPDQNGVLRIHTVVPTNATDLDGAVVGAQTSYFNLKENIRPLNGIDYHAALQTVVNTPLYEYEMIVEAPKKRRVGYVIYEKDKGGWFSYNDNYPGAIPALDERNILGNHAAAIKALYDRVVALEQKLPA